MFFEEDPNIACSITLPFKPSELRKEKKNLEEYYTQLLFILRTLDLVLPPIDLKPERKTIYLNENLEYVLGPALNGLLYDQIGKKDCFSKEDIYKYQDKLRQELDNIEKRIKGIRIILSKCDNGCWGKAGLEEYD